MNLQTLAQTLGGEICGCEVLAPGPGLSPWDRSLSIRPDPQAPGGFRVHSFANDDWRRCRNYVRDCLGRAQGRTAPCHEAHDPLGLPAGTAARIANALWL